MLTPGMLVTVLYTLWAETQDVQFVVFHPDDTLSIVGVTDGVLLVVSSEYGVLPLRRDEYRDDYFRARTRVL